jgi:hypothetical protein
VIIASVVLVAFGLVKQQTERAAKTVMYSYDHGQSQYPNKLLIHSGTLKSSRSIELQANTVIQT